MYIYIYISIHTYIHMYNAHIKESELTRTALIEAGTKSQVGLAILCYDIL